jgi:hypothetical protein
MTRPRITIVKLMVIILIVAFGLAVLINNRRKNAEIAHLTTIIREQCDQLDRQRTPLDIPDGYVTNVDDERREVVITITRPQGARPGMRMTIYGWASPGIPDEKQRAAIQISQANEQFSTARVVNTYNSSVPE